MSTNNEHLDRALYYLRSALVELTRVITTAQAPIAMTVNRGAIYNAMEATLRTLRQLDADLTFSTPPALSDPAIAAEAKPLKPRKSVEERDEGPAYAPDPDPDSREA